MGPCGSGSILLARVYGTCYSDLIHRWIHHNSQRQVSPLLWKLENCAFCLTALTRGLGCQYMLSNLLDQSTLLLSVLNTLLRQSHGSGKPHRGYSYIGLLLLIKHVENQALHCKVYSSSLKEDLKLTIYIICSKWMPSEFPSLIRTLLKNIVIKKYYSNLSKRNRLYSKQDNMIYQCVISRNKKLRLFTMTRGMVPLSPDLADNSHFSPCLFVCLLCMVIINY